ncbi:hypothetical protein HDU98_011347 [Podochytrium sp. JEL0797]|nr:hypothetical protein HDU98_011347 [Podochytrium sp. JEL0797]
MTRNGTRMIRFKADINSTKLLRISKPMLTRFHTRLNHVEIVNAPHQDVTDNHVISVLKHTPHVKRLELGGCRYLSVNLIPFLPTLTQELTKLDVSNTYLDDGAVQFLARNCVELVDLNFSQCPRVSDVGVLAVCGRMAERVQVLKMAACFAVSRVGFQKALFHLATRADELETLDISCNSSNVDAEVMMEFAISRNARIEAVKSKLCMAKANRALVVDITGDGWEFTKEEIASVQKADPTLRVIHNAKMANHDETGVKEYLQYLTGAHVVAY